ncbi:MAG: hypothetical protein ACFFAJ_14115 [Candidatus Hodarchaeota archaeon]
MGKESLCYTQDIRPLVQRVDSPDAYYCPLLKFTLSNDAYEEISSLVEFILAIQDEESTGINLWPMLSGISNPKKKSVTTRGIRMEHLSQKVRDRLEKIVYELY